MVSKTQILTAVWGYDGFDENVVEVHVSSLRRKLEAGGRPRLVHTVRGRGLSAGRRHREHTGSPTRSCPSHRARSPLNTVSIRLRVIAAVIIVLALC